LRAALADGVLTVNPTLGVRLPRPPASELVVPAPETVHALLHGADPSFRVAVVLGAFVGLRAGEAQGLLTTDVDFLRRQVNVRRQLVDKPPRLAEPKTHASTRAVPVPASVLDELAAHIERHGTGRDGVLLHQADGEYLHANRFNYLWRITQRAAGLEVGSLRFHSLRHAFASALISAGASVKAVSVAMGHTNATTTLETYASLWPGDDDRIRVAIATAWRTEDS
jgi:integrase